MVTIINPLWAFFFDLHVGQINLGTFVVAHTSCSSVHSWFSMPLCRSISDSVSSFQSSLLSLRLSQPPFQLSQCSVPEMLTSVLSSSLWPGWWSILHLWCTLNTSVRTPGRSFADKAGAKGDLSDNINSAPPSCWKFHEHALMISSVSKMYSMAAICLFSVQDSFCIACWLLLPGHISKTF